MQRERFTMIFAPETYTKPITYQLVKEFDLKINILRAEITPGEEGHLLMEIEGDEGNMQKALRWLASEQIKVFAADKHVSIDKDACVHCGACCAVCFSGAIVMNRSTWQTEFTPDKCILCGLCINACPRKIIRIGFGDQ